MGRAERRCWAICRWSRFHEPTVKADSLELLAGATLVMLAGVHGVPQVTEDALPPGAHRVEYIAAGGIELPTDHVDVRRAKPPGAG